MSTRFARTSARVTALAASLLLLAAAPAASAGPPAALDLAATPALEADATALLAFAGAQPAPADADFEYLYDGYRLAFDAEGRAEATTHFIVRVLTTRGAETFRSYTVNYRPGLQAGPVLRARVIAPDGRVSPLDPKTASEQPVAASDDVYTDLRALTAPLPGVAPGALVEIATVTRDLALPYRSGVLRFAGLDSTAPNRRLRVEVTAPASLALRWRVLGLPLPGGVAPKLSRSAAGTRLLCDHVPPLRPRALLDQPTAPSFAYLAVATAPSWAAAADEYGDLVAGVLAAPAPGGAAPAPALAALAAEVVGDAQGADAIVARIHAWMAAKLRYTGLSLGEAAWTPTAPLEVVARGYGDCKDLATLFVALARARGLSADVALVRAGRDSDPPADLPGLGWFDHAIVALSGPSVRWLDATASTVAPGHLPEGLAGRPVLIARRGETALRALPPLATDDGWEEVREVTLVADGPGRLVERTTGRGAAAGRLRQWWKGTRTDEQGGAWVSYAKANYGDVTAARAEASGVTPAADPFVSTVTLEGLASARLDRGEGSLELPLGGVLDVIPGPLREVFPAATPSERAWRDRWLARSVPLDLGRVDRASVTWRIAVPRGVAVVKEPALPPGFEVGPVRFEAAFEREGAVVSVRYRFTAASSVLSPAEVVALHDALRKLYESPMPALKLGWAYDAPVAAGDLVGAVKLAAEVYAAEPEGLMPGHWYAHALFDAGLVEASLAAARELAARFPAAPGPQFLIGQAAAKNPVGREFGPGYERDAAITALRAGLALEPGHTPGRRLLLSVLLRDAAGGPKFRGDPAWVEEVLALSAALEAEGDASFAPARAAVLIGAGRHGEAMEVVRAMERSKYRQMMGLLAVATAEGVAAALRREAEFATSDTASMRLALAGAMAIELGQDSVAAGLMAAASAGAPGDKGLASLARAYGRLVSDSAAPAGDPCLLARRFWGAHARADAARLAAGLPERYRSRNALTAEEPLVGMSMLPVWKALIDQSPRSAALAAGFVVCEPLRAAGRVVPVKLSVDAGGEAGLSVTHAIVLGPGKKGEAAVVLPATGLFLGTEALFALEAKRVDEARRLLEVALEAGTAGPMDGVLRHWGLARDAGALAGLDEGRLGVLAASLAPTGPARALARRRIEGAKDREAAPLARARALATAAVGELGAAVALVERLPASEAASAAPLVAVWLHAHGAADVDALWSRLSAAGLEPGIALSERATVSIDRGDFATGRALFEQVRGREGVSAFEASVALNDLAWLSLFDGHDLGEALARVEEVRDRRRPVEHTRATLLAALGRPAEAVAALEASIPASATALLADRLVLGRAAQAYGLHEVARAYYQKAATEETKSPTSSRRLAEKWLAELPPAPPAPGGPRAGR